MNYTTYDKERKQTHLAEDKKDCNPTGVEDELASRKLDVLIENIRIPGVRRPFMCRESHIAFT